MEEYKPRIINYEDYRKIIIDSLKEKNETPKIKKHYFSKQQAEWKLELLKKCIEKYGSVSIADYYEFVDVYNSSDISEQYYGWTDLSSAKICKYKFGYGIKFPEAKILE